MTSIHTDPTIPDRPEKPDEMPLEEVRKILTGAGYDLPAVIHADDPHLLLVRKLGGDDVSPGGIILAKEEDRMAAEVVWLSPDLPAGWVRVADEVTGYRHSLHDAFEVNRLVYGTSEVNHGAFFVMEASSRTISGIVRKGKA